MIGKKGYSEKGNFNYRRLEDINKAIQPLLIKYGVFCAPTVLESNTQMAKTGKLFRTVLKIRHRFYSVDGSYIDVVTQGESIDSSDKSSSMAMSNAMKYAFIELFNISGEDIEGSELEIEDLNFEGE